MKSICVFGGSTLGADRAYAEAAHRLGAVVAASGLRLVYGGGRVGLMGALADGALEAGGEVVGVIPRWLVETEFAHPGLSELRVVGSVAERKAVMAELADGFVALPGGVGTLDELFEVWALWQMGRHGKAFGVLDVNGFFAPLLAYVDRLVAEGFLRAESRAMLVADENPARLLERLGGAGVRG